MISFIKSINSWFLVRKISIGHMTKCHQFCQSFSSIQNLEFLPFLDLEILRVVLRRYPPLCICHLKIRIMREGLFRIVRKRIYVLMKDLPKFLANNYTIFTIITIIFLSVNISPFFSYICLSLCLTECCSKVYHLNMISTRVCS